MGKKNWRDKNQIFCPIRKKSNMIKRTSYYVFFNGDAEELYRIPLRGRPRKDAMPYVWGHRSIIILSNEEKKGYNKIDKKPIEKMSKMEAMAERAIEEAKVVAGVYD